MTKEIEAEVASLDKDFDSSLCKHYWRVTLWVEEPPDLKLGKCKVVQ